MKIRMTKTVTFAGGCYLQSETYEVQQEIATALVDYECAVFVDCETPAKNRQKAIKGKYETR